MAIKWKNINSSLWLKLVAVVLTLSGVLIVNSFLPYLPVLEYALGPAQYSDSIQKEWQLANIKHSLTEIVNRYLDEEYITSGQSTQVEFDDYSRYRRQQYNQQVADINERYAAWIARAEKEQAEAEIAHLLAEQAAMLGQRTAELEEDLALHKALFIEGDLHNYRVHREILDTPDIYYYYKALTSDEIVTNIPNGGEPEAFFNSLPAHSKSMTNMGTYYQGLGEERFQTLADEFAELRQQGLTGLYGFAGGVSLTLCGLGLTIMTAGRRFGQEGIHLTAFDPSYLDIGVILPVFVILFLGVGIVDRASSVAWQFHPWLTTALLVLTTLLFLFYSSTLAKRVKRGELLKHTLCYAVLAWTARLLRKWSDSGPPLWRNLGLLAAYASGLILAVTILITAIDAAVFLGFGLFLLVNVAAVSLILRRTTELQNITSGTERIRNGDLSFRITATRSREMTTLAELINNIAIGLGTAVESEVRSERMKAELITNVSHDLKTPLTSLITYIDLLKNEGLDSDNAAKYLDVLDRKSQRLQSLTEDLFEAAKAASGNIAMKRERVDVGSLLTQGLGELSEKIAASQLDWRIHIPQEKLFVQADGRLLWRVMENLLSNILKYALVGSRVYVEAIRADQTVRVTFKNISASALNVDPAELMERFTRGDAARQGEGSGLGLAIAKSLTELQGGQFEITIDGDLFKASVSLPYSF